MDIVNKLITYFGQSTNDSNISINQDSIMSDLWKIESKIESLRAKNAELEAGKAASDDKADAERFRYMKNNDATDIYSDWNTYKLNPFEFDYLDLDIEIDKAMSEKG